MKKILKLVAVATFVCLMSTSGLALTINDTGVVGIIENPFNQNAEVDNVTEWANYLLGLVGLGVSVTADGNTPLDGVTEDYETSSTTDYTGVLSGGLRINGSTPDVSGYDWVLGKYNGQNAGYVLFYMPDFGSSIPEFDYEGVGDTIWGGSVGQYQLSNVTVFGATSVPEPATMLLLGTGLVGLAGLRRRFKK